MNPSQWAAPSGRWVLGGCTFCQVDQWKRPCHSELAASPPRVNPNPLAALFITMLPRRLKVPLVCRPREDVSTPGRPREVVCFGAAGSKHISEKHQEPEPSETRYNVPAKAIQLPNRTYSVSRTKARSSRDSEGVLVILNGISHKQNET